MLTLSDFIVVVYCLVSDLFASIVGDQRLRRRGPMPALTDSEVITMEIVGEFLGRDTDKGIWEYFREGRDRARSLLRYAAIDSLMTLL